MTRLRPLSVIDQAEIALRHALAQGKWSGTLPSYATLSDFLGVSVPTVSIAVSRLAKAGLVASQGKRRRYRIEPAARRARTRRPSPPGMPLPTRYLLIAGIPQRDQLDPWRSRLVMEAMRELRREGWVCDYDALPFSGARVTKAGWDRVLARHPATHLLLFDATPPVVRWARSRGLSVALMGGQALPGVPSLGVDLEAVIRHVVGKLASLGHRKVLIPLPDDPPAMAEAVARSAAGLLGYTPSQLLDRGWVFSARLRTPAERRSAIAARLRQLSPTALVCMSWRDCLVARDVLRDLGLEAPRDLSLVVMDSGDDMDWVNPAPTRFNVGHDLILRGTLAWLEGKPFDTAQSAKAMIKGWVDGETLAAPPPVPA
jgi:DNA-binding LacI/PurR family transcriptional regulator